MQFSLLTFIKYANHNHNFDFEVCIMVRKNKSYQKKKKKNQISPSTFVWCDLLFALPVSRAGSSSNNTVETVDGCRKVC